MSDAKAVGDAVAGAAAASLASGNTGAAPSSAASNTDTPAAATRGTISKPNPPAPASDASFAEITARRRGRVRRYLFQHPRVMDAVVVCCYLALATPTIVGSIMEDTPLVVVVLATIGAILFYRRCDPLTVTAAVALFEVGATLLNPWGSNVSAGLWFALYAVAVSRPRKFTFFALAAASLPLALVYLFMGTGPEAEMGPDGIATSDNLHLVSNIAAAISIMLSNMIATGVGISVRQRREHEGEIAAWAARTAQLGSVNERNRIAREMHDVVAHSLTVMISLSDGAAVVVKKDPGRAGEVLGELSRTGRTALADMRRVLGVLRDESTNQPPLEPLAASDNLAKLLEGFRTAGLPLHYSHTGPSLPEDPAFRLTVYRILQESLTNVLRYGRGLTRVDVRVAFHGDTVTIEVLDDGREHRDGVSLGTGQGIAGMRERARIYAGTVEAGQAANGGWQVKALLHWNGEKGKS